MRITNVAGLSRSGRRRLFAAVHRSFAARFSSGRPSFEAKGLYVAATTPLRDGWPARGTHLGHVLSGPDRIALMKSRQLVNPARCCGGRDGGRDGGREERREEGGREKKTSRLIRRRMRHHPRKGRRVEKRWGGRAAEGR